MDSGKKLFDDWVKSQLDLFDKMELFDTCLSSQERFLTNWIDSVRSFHEVIQKNQEKNEIPNMKLYYQFFNTWFDASSALSDEILQKQKLLENTIQKQAEIFKEMLEKSVNTTK